MNRVLVIGSSGAGKSTFSRRLADITGLPLIHLDRFFWKPGWVETDKAEWSNTVARALEGERWIIDGNYGGTMEMRLAACDTAIFLDLPRTICTYRVVKRLLVYRRGTRPDMADGCDEHLDLKFIKFVWTYPKRSRPSVIGRLDRIRDSKTVISLRSLREVESFLSQLSDRKILFNGNNKGRIHDQH